MRLLEGEELVMILRPHPLAFMRYISLCIYLMIVGVAFYSMWGELAKIANASVLGLPLTLVLWWGLLLLAPTIVGLLHVTFWPLLCAIGLGAVGTALVLCGLMPLSSLGPFTVAGGILGLFVVEAMRRGHKYYITNRRIIMSKEFISKSERYVYYEDITDVVPEKGLLGRVFNFGNIIIATASGIGTGVDLAGLGVSTGGKVQRLGLDVTLVGARGVTEPRARPHFQLFGVPRPEDVAHEIEELRASWKAVPYLRRIAGTAEEIKRMLEQGGRKL
ncbi:hypothetical protein DRO33_05300 [Candidatus Bathyarchaeota archaeon]|nr:MAG: hypothetical protein DRO33_05300 [Candidatus Bathyarchaeota archaeon]